MRATALWATLLVALSVSGCSASVGKEAVSASELADRVAEEQQAQNPDKKVTDVTCDGELEPKDGAEQRCHATDARGDRKSVV